MEHRYQNGKIIIRSNYFTNATYHIANERISVILNGKGAVVGYAPANETDILNGWISLFRNHAPIDIYSEKTVEMIGRSQLINVHLGDAHLKITQFLDASVNGVFISYELISERKDDCVRVSFGLNTSIKDATLEKTELIAPGLRFGANTEISFVSLNKAVYFDVKAGKSVYTFLSGGSSAIPTLPIVSNFKKYQEKMQAEIDSVKIPNGLSEEQKALFLSAYFCSLQNYKSLNGYNAFMAGHHYLLPMRSYYRDSYYTVLPMYIDKPELVKEQIITLAMGINENGNCPSAVKSNYSEFWGNHYDSPSFLAMMLYDYVKLTGKIEILSYDIKGETILQKAENAVKKLSSFADETSLIYKEGPYNLRDWADEVHRTGYVTYVEALYARALFCLSKTYEILDDASKAASYMRHFETVKQAINDILWDDDLGYYVNFKDKDFTEKNLSVDTCFVALFGIANHERAVRMLQNMENILETRNNNKQKAGDYGVMCVYPFYAVADGAKNKSIQPYNYHNGANWPYLSAMYAATKRKYGMEYRYALESWFDYNVQRGYYTPVEYFSPPHPTGSSLQAWSSVAAFIMDEDLSRDFWD